jgi:hypothetical protein
MLVSFCLLSACLAEAGSPPGSQVPGGDKVFGEANVPMRLIKVVGMAVEPCIFPQPPPTISLALHASTNLSVPVVHGSPFHCQWSFNGLPMPGVTGTDLAISNFDVAKAGIYSVAVTNPYGSATAATVLRLDNSPIVLVDGAGVGARAVSRTNTTEISMSSTFGSDAGIYYTLDGSDPDFTATPYSAAFTLTNTATIRAIAYNFLHTSWAEAAPIHVEIWPVYQLSATTLPGGSVSISPAPYSENNLYLSNTIVTLTATPSNGWAFVSWTGDNTDTTNVTTVLMDRPRAVQASFQV